MRNILKIGVMRIFGTFLLILLTGCGGSPPVRLQSDIYIDEINSDIRHLKLLNETFKGQIQEYNTLVNAMNREWAEFRYGLSNDQVKRLEILNEHKNKESFGKFQGALSDGQKKALTNIRQKIDSERQKRAAIAYMANEIEKQYQMVDKKIREVERISAYERQRQAYEDAVFFGFMEQVERTAQGIRQRSHNTQMMNTFRSIDMNLGDINRRLGY